MSADSDNESCTSSNDDYEDVEGLDYNMWDDDSGDGDSRLQQRTLQSAPAPPLPVRSAKYQMPATASSVDVDKSRNVFAPVAAAAATATVATPVATTNIRESFAKRANTIANEVLGGMRSQESARTLERWPTVLRVDYEEKRRNDIDVFLVNRDNREDPFSIFIGTFNLLSTSSDASLRDIIYSSISVKVVESRKKRTSTSGGRRNAV